MFCSTGPRLNCLLTPLARLCRLDAMADSWSESSLLTPADLPICSPSADSTMAFCAPTTRFTTSSSSQLRSGWAFPYSFMRRNPDFLCGLFWAVSNSKLGLFTCSSRPTPGSHLQSVVASHPQGGPADRLVNNPRCHGLRVFDPVASPASALVE